MISLSLPKIKQKPFLLAFLVTAGFAIAYLVVTNPLLALGPAVLLIGTLFVLLLFYRPIFAFYAFVFFLPIHSLIITILLTKVGLPIPVLKGIAAWKEALLFGTLLLVLLRMLLRSKGPWLNLIDLIALTWLAQVVLYFFLHDMLFGWDSGLQTRLYGARDWLLYLVPYFIGRFVFVSERSARRILAAVLFISVITSLSGFFEYFFIPLEWHIQLGVPRYFREFLGLDYPDYLGGLPENYWTNFGPLLLRRPVSTYLSGQGFAIPFLVIIPIAIYNYFAGITRFRRVILLINVAALLLSLTRMTIIACVIEFFLLLWIMRKKRKFILALFLAGILLIISVAASSTMRDFVWKTITFSDHSSSTRPEQYLSGLQMMLENPLGQGLGSSGQSGTRFGLSSIGEEAGYLKITTALGVPGLVFFLSWMFGIFILSWKAYRRANGTLSGIGLVTCGMTVGFLVNNLTAPPDQSLFVIYLFCWLAGTSVQIAQRTSFFPVSTGQDVEQDESRQNSGSIGQISGQVAE